MYNIILLLFFAILFRIERLPSVIGYIRGGVDRLESDSLILDYISKLVYG